MEAGADITESQLEFVEKMLSGQLASEGARRFAQLPRETIAFTLPAIQQQLAQSNAAGAKQPSAAIPPLQKHNASDNPRGKKRRNGADSPATKERVAQRPNPTAPANTNAKVAPIAEANSSEPGTPATESAKTFLKT